MTLSIMALISGLALLVWSADRFVAGAAAIAGHFRMPPLLIGMVVVGFGTSAPEMAVSSLAAWQQNAGIALGNAYGSNITNIALILGLTALLRPIAVHAQVIRRELPILLMVTGLAAWQLRDNLISRPEAMLLLVTIFGLVGWSARQALSDRAAAPTIETTQTDDASTLGIKGATLWLVAGLALLIASSRLLVWGAVDIAQTLGVDDLLIGLTIVAVGTSLPELASSLAAARKGEDDIVLGNILGSNLFNTLAVVGLAGVIRPLQAPPEVFRRDIAVMAGATLLLALLGLGFHRTGRVNRFEGALLLMGYAAYLVWLARAIR